MGETLDITDRKNVQDKLLEEEQRFRALADQSSDIIIMVNREGIVTYENPSVSILGFSVEEKGWAIMLLSFSIRMILKP